MAKIKPSTYLLFSGLLGRGSTLGLTGEEPDLRVGTEYVPHLGDNREFLGPLDALPVDLVDLEDFPLQTRIDKRLISCHSILEAALFQASQESSFEHCI